MTISFDNSDLSSLDSLAETATGLGVTVEALISASRQRVQAALTGQSGSLPDSWRKLIFAAGSGITVSSAAGIPAEISASRIAAYQRTACRQLIADPDADPRQQSLLSATETDYLLNGLAGRRRDLGDRRAHQLFEQQVRLRPDAIAATAGDHDLSYAELNRRANRLAHQLVTDGLRPEDVVAVITERTLDWLTAVLAVFKAGGAYLPIEPGFPDARIARMLDRSDCRTVLTGETIAAVVRTVGPDHDLDLAIGPDRLAYIYFTSGSTGEPKGAMCEHAGMLNHLLAKIDDCEISARSVVAQTAPQSFDISLWQLISALLVGGRTVLIDQPTILDVSRFVDTVITERVGVLQLVPSYLDTVLESLEQRPRPLPDLRCLSVTGEALPPGLVRRWFGRFPDVPMLNAYGLTETSDDTNHELLRRPPADDRVPVGRLIGGVRAYLVDDCDQLVPFGAQGEIVFSGVCVGRGYINDPERTARVFGPDPHYPGSRRYRSGDIGRWRPDGKLEFLGRRDAQVKIRGFRVEIGEIEQRLAGVPGIDQVAVVVIKTPSPHLVAFYTGAPGLDGLDDRLRRDLPAYMIPQSFQRRERLPLTPNGKIDRRELTASAVQLQSESATADPPRTAAEGLVAKAWSNVLGIDPQLIGRHDHFFDRGGTSLSAVKLAIALDCTVTIKDITRHPVLADLAGLLPSDLSTSEK
jgi:amino acid adenylation domain-containing protein